MGPPNKKKPKLEANAPNPKNLFKLSKNLMQMKFMQRSRKEYEKQVEEKEGPIDFKATDQKERNQITYQTSYVLFEKLRFGRMSFKNMNVDIEQLMNTSNTSIKREAPDTAMSSDDDEGSDDGEIEYLR